MNLWAFYTFILSSKCALVLLSLIAHTACLLTHDLDSEFRISQLGLLMGKSRDKRNEVLLVSTHYTIDKASWCREFKLSLVSAELLRASLKYSVTSRLWFQWGQPKAVHLYLSEILGKRIWSRDFGSWALRWNFRSKRNFIFYNFKRKNVLFVCLKLGNTYLSF